MLTITVSGDDMDQIYYQLQDILRAGNKKHENLMRNVQLNMMLDIKLESLDLSTRITNIIINELKFKTIYDVLKFGYNRLSYIQNLGKGSMKELGDMLQRHDLNWASHKEVL